MDKEDYDMPKKEQKKDNVWDKSIKKAQSEARKNELKKRKAMHKMMNDVGYSRYGK